MALGRVLFSSGITTSQPCGTPSSTFESLMSPDIPQVQLVFATPEQVLGDSVL